MSDIIVTEQAAPASPAATKHAVYVDSTTKKLASKDSAGAVTNYGIVAPGADGNVLTAASGAWTSAAPTGGDGWTAGTGTWSWSSGVQGTAFSRAYTNDPASGSNIELDMADTSGFNVGDLVIVSSSAGSEQAIITVVHTNTHLTVDVLALNHTTTNRLVARPINPQFVLSVNNDQTTILGVGQRIKLTQTTARYFIVTTVGAYSGGVTLITLYGGTDYALDNAPITNPSWSNIKAPFGFPTSPDKWTNKTTDTAQYSQASPVAGTFYNLGLASLTIPTGVWLVKYSVSMQANITGTAINAYAALSTSCSSASDGELIDGMQNNLPSGSLVLSRSAKAEKTLTITQKTTYYLLSACYSISASILYNNIMGTRVISATCAYL